MFSCVQIILRKSVQVQLNNQQRKNMSKYSKDVYNIFISGVDAVQPQTLIRKNVKIINNKLYVTDREYTLQKPCYVVGFGKAVMGMAVQLERILDANLAGGICTIPVGIAECFKNQPHLLPAPNSKIQYFEGAENNLPDVDAMRGAQKIKNLCDSLTHEDLVIVLISGGGSSLLPLPHNGISLEDKLWLVKALANAGADICELNTVRKKISQLKGGGLAMSAYPAKVISLILSDVIGNPIDFIASGPTVLNLDESNAALNVVKKYNLFNTLPTNILHYLKQDVKETQLINADNYIIGSNEIACNAAKECANKLGYESLILSTRINGNVNEISNMYSELVKLIVNHNETTETSWKLFYEKFEEYLNTSKIKDLSIATKNIIANYNPDTLLRDICIISSGEPTVKVSGFGKGGRNQHLALAFSKVVASFNLKYEVTFLSCGTDGIDGPTDAAGAITNSNLFSNAVDLNLNPNEFLNQHDSYNFFETYINGDHLIKIGHSGTNVMDLHVIVIACHL